MTIDDLPQPVTSPVPGRPRLYRLREALHVPVGPFLVVVPAGFLTDGATIPRFAWPLVGHPMHGPYQAAAVCHDHFYTTQELSRLVADALFCEILRQYGVSRRRARLMYGAVRLAGWLPWCLRARRRNKDRRKEQDP